MDKKDAFDSTELDAAGPSRFNAPSEANVLGSQFQDHSPHDVPAEAAPPKYTEHALENVYIPAGGEEPPPEFTPYEAEFFISGREIISHDPHLNQDGEALYRFLLSQSQTRPEYQLHARGTHTEHKTRTVFRQDQQGKTTTHQEHYTETVTDFDFYIDIGCQIVHGPVHWSLPDAEPAYRGDMVLQVDSDDLVTGDAEASRQHGRRKATKEEIKAAKERKRLRKEHGLPPWIVPGPESWYNSTGVSPPPEAQVLGSSLSLRDWADEYCASDKLLKEFTYTKVIYGWNIANLQEAVVSAIRSVYSHNITVEFEMSNHMIRIRPDNRLSRTLSNMWLKFLLWILLIYPFIWLYKRFGRRGGGRWEVCGGAYALKTWRLEPGAVPPPQGANDGRWKQTQDGLAHLVGEREGEWFQRWEGPIRGAVLGRVRSKTPLQPVNVSAMRLDGYQPAYISPSPNIGYLASPGGC
ncbi:hypothetical protein GY45DRAFT_1317129 [Cubamyces sp. BRFM 1775]|nr:hypothetical protein GY45DRAFT_1317129 [Cubamyces sp. BRFM 1775]